MSKKKPFFRLGSPDDPALVPGGRFYTWGEIARAARSAVHKSMVKLRGLTARGRPSR